MPSSTDQNDSLVLGVFLILRRLSMTSHNLKSVLYRRLSMLNFGEPILDMSLVSLTLCTEFDSS